MKRILLVSPDFDCESFWITDEEGTCAEVLNDVAPLGLATVAGLTPDGYQVDIWDEVVHGRIEPETGLPAEYDLVGVTGYNSHFLRCREIAKVARAHGAVTVIGGPGVSGMPDKHRGHFDVMFIGEAERTWPQFLRDWEGGSFESEYRQIEKLDLAESPLPKWDSIAGDMSRYAMGAAQTTRGCPFDCEFCDVIYLFGRKARHKPIPLVVEEIVQLQKLGMTNVFFCDDEFIGDPKYTKELLRALIPVNNSFPQPLTFSTQLTMNLSKDEELLELVADANFEVVFVGIETPNKASLKETGKYQNVRDDLAADVRKVLSYGIAIRAGLIVGFDHDDTSVFDTHLDFVTRSHLPSTTLSMLKAIPGTRLWRRLRLEGRVLDITKVRGDSKVKGDGFKPRSYTNVVPKGMTRGELMLGYKGLAEQLYSWDAINVRLRDFISNLKRLPQVRQEPLSEGEWASLRRVGDDNPAARRCIDEVVAHTQKVAPTMMRRIRTLILHHAKHADTFGRLLPFIDRLVELESSEQISFGQDSRPVPIPEAFRSAVSKYAVLSGLHRRIYLNLEDKGRVAEALTEVFVDFLVRWGEGFEAFEPHHSIFLEELCDRTCAAFSGRPPETFVPVLEADVEVPDVRRTKLAEDVLKATEQALMKLGQTDPQAGPISAA